MRHEDLHARKTTAVTWTNQAGGDWATAANWSGDAVPNSNDAVTINTAALETVTHSTGSDTVYSLTVGNDVFVLSGGSLDVLRTASFANGFEQTGGSFQGGAVTIKGNGTLTGGAALGSTVLSISGTAALANYTLGGSAEIKNAKAINQTGGITIGDNTGVDATIVNGSGATYAIAGDFGVGAGASSASITNAGIFAKTAGNGTSAVGVSIVSTGTISVLAGGDLQFDGPSSIIGGVLSGAGEVSFAGSGGNTLTLGTATIGAIGLYSAATLSLAGTASVLNGTLYDQSNGSDTLALGAGTLTVNGAADFEGNFGTANLSGTGRLMLNGATTAYNADFGGTLAIANAGDFSVTGGGVTLGDGSGGVVGLTNSSAGTLQLTVDDGIGSGSGTSDFITNAGLIEKSSGSGTSAFGVVVDNTAAGTITVASGSIQIADSLNNAGTIGGSGQLDVTGSSTLSAGTTLSVGQFGIYDTGFVTLGTSLAYAGIFSDNSNGSDTLELGTNTLTLTGKQDSITGAYGTAYVGGTGALVTSAAATLTIAGAQIGGTVGFTNDGSVLQTSTVTIGDGSGETATITNAHGASWTVTGDDTINEGASSASSFHNAGLVTVQAGNGQASMAADFDNQSGGTVTIASGSLGDNDFVTNAGTISGNDFAVNNSAQAVLATGSKVTTSSFDLYGSAVLAVDVQQTYAGTFNDLSNGTTTIELNGANLNLSGTANFVGAFGVAYIDGSGTLSLTGVSTLNAAELGGTVATSNAGTLLASGNLQIGDGSSNAATFTNAAKGVYDVVNDSGGISHGNSLLSDFVNTGLFEKTAGTGTNVISAAFTNNGTITVTSGTLEFTAGSLTNNGVINGVKTTDGNGNIFITHH